MAVSLNRANEEIAKEQIITNNLREQRLLKEISIQSTIEHRRRSNECSSYNILSVDGGGIRGIMAAIWLRILELKTNRTCSSVFQMMAGTSTGAIIAAGLSMPKKHSLTEPAYDTSELVKLYRTRGDDIFVKKERAVYSLRNLSISFSSKYSSHGKRKIFEHYFRDTSLYECLTDIVIPAVRSSDIYTHLFTKTGRLNSTPLVDVLMATTAAPTYFKPHCLNGTNFTDGGVQMNNPTLAAYPFPAGY
ncbi:unnamed protein product [Rotaria sp. Silwood1]|nr:unnamed protein product [Rotaria sp. Silwood1]CAF4771236.1 unnamed protein product [Rotaria sp. Silwood1]